MYAFLTKLLITHKISFEEGRIKLFNEPYAIIGMSSLKEMTEDAVSRGIKDISDLYYYGWVFGFTGVKSAVKMFKLKKFQDRYKLSMDVAALIGFGDYKTIAYKRGQYAKFKVLKNPFALQFHPSKQMVDHYLRGVNAGGGTVGHEVLMQCIELDCAAQNGKECLFINVSEEALDKLDKKTVSSQLNIEYVKKKQTALLEELGENLADYKL